MSVHHPMVDSGHFTRRRAMVKSRYVGRTTAFLSGKIRHLGLRRKYLQGGGDKLVYKPQEKLWSYPLQTIVKLELLAPT